MCITLEFIRKQKIIAWRKREHHEVMRLTHDEQVHLERCSICSGNNELELHRQLWKNAVIGIDTIQVI